TDDLRERRNLRLGQTGGRLVEQEEARARRERPSDAEPPLVALSERVRGCIGVRRQPECVEQLLGPCACSRRPRACTEGGDLDVLADGERAKSVAVLERPREPGAAAAARPPVGDVPA